MLLYTQESYVHALMSYIFIPHYIYDNNVEFEQKSLGWKSDDIWFNVVLKIMFSVISRLFVKNEDFL